MIDLLSEDRLLKASGYAGGLSTVCHFLTWVTAAMFPVNIMLNVWGVYSPDLFINVITTDMILLSLFIGGAHFSVLCERYINKILEENIRIRRFFDKKEDK